jgi:hypothetical protein
VRPAGRDVDSSLAGGWIEVATTSTRQRGRDQYAPGQRVANGPDSEIEKLQADLSFQM